MKIRNSLLIIFISFTAIIIAGQLASNEVKDVFKNLKYKEKNSFKEGDIIFQSSQSEQCEAVRVATNSKFSHCGIIFYENGICYVFEAIQPVKKTKFTDWITHGLNQKYVVARLKDSTLLNAENIAKMKEYGKKEFNKEYDIYFEWSDEKIYCSE